MRRESRGQRARERIGLVDDGPDGTGRGMVRVCIESGGRWGGRAGAGGRKYFQR